MDNFLFAHGVSGGTAFALRGPISAATRRWLRLSMVANMVADPALLVVIVTGVWMAFLGPDTPPLGERSKTSSITQSQIAATLAALLGEDYAASEPTAGKPIADVVPLIR